MAADDDRADDMSDADSQDAAEDLDSDVIGDQEDDAELSGIDLVAVEQADGRLAAEQVSVSDLDLTAEEAALHILDD
jgi:hypothetical protein